MLLIVVSAAICAVLVFRDLKPLFGQDKKLFWLYAVLLFLFFAASIAVGMGVKLPSPAQPIKDLITAIFDLRD